MSNETEKHDLQHEITTKRPTVEELLKMLSGSGSGSKRPSPPPVPPKPKPGFEMSIEAAKRSLGLLPDPKKAAKATDDATGGSKSVNRTFIVDNAGDQLNPPGQHVADDLVSKVISDPVEKHDATTHLTKLSPSESRVGYHENNEPPPATSITRIIASPRARVHPRSPNPPTSPPQATAESQQAPTSTAINNLSDAQEYRRHQRHPSQRPIVTESPEETNNNHVNRRPAGSTMSTVEILEVPQGGHSLSRDIHSNASGNKKGPTVSRELNVDQPQHYTAGSYAQRSESATTNLALVTTTADSDEYDKHNDDDVGVDAEDVQLAKEVETIMSDSLLSDGQPPRTSTPTPTPNTAAKLYQVDSTNSSGGTSTATNNNNNRSSYNAYMNESALHYANPLSDNNSEGDLLNASRDTDELTNTSANNQSGCELVGVNDNSDSKDNSPRKIEQKSSIQEQPTPYTVQFFNDTMLSPTNSSTSPPGISNNNNNNSQQSSTEAIDKRHKKYEMSIHEIESNSLRKLVSTLQNQIENLNNKVSGLTSKVEDLETELERQKRDVTLSSSKSISSIYNSNNDSQHGRDKTYQSPSGTMQKLSPLSQSVSTINKLTPMKASRHGNSNYGLMSTYSRSGLSQHQQQQSLLSQHNSSTGGNHLGHMQSTNAKCSQASQSFTGSMSRQPHSRKSNVHTSTNSLYAESNKSGSASISPTPLESSTLSNRQYASPSSYLNSSQQKREPTSYTSMLSLSSLGNSTLKKSIAGSVSNLSQFTTSTTQLSSWPSLSNFITAKHQAKDILYDEQEQVIRMVLYNTLITMKVPSWLGPDYCFDTIIDAPPVKLRLDWVHGYRGRDCRSNIYYLPTGECIYFVASIVILYNPEEKKQRHYLGHTDSVKCLAIHPNKLIVASGQSAIANRRDKRPIVRVWNTVSLATLRVIGFNEDFDRSICCLAFSKHDAGATLAVVDESSEHTITLLDWQREKNWRVSEVNSGHEPVLAIDFHPIDKYSLVAVGKSSINFWDIRGMTLAKKAGLFDKYDRPKYVSCMTFNDLGETITGDSNGNIIIWPRGTNKPRRIIRDVHPGGVLSVLAMKDGSYLTGGRDRRIVEWDENFEPTGRQAELPEHCGGVRFITCARGAQVLIGTLRNSILLGSLDTSFQVIMQGHTEATTALAMHPSYPKYLTGGFDDQIQFIDAQTHELEWSKCMAMPITAASFSPNGTILILGSTSGDWVALDAITQEVLFTACDGTGTINCVKFSQNGELFAMGSSDCHIYVYQTTPSGNTFRRLGTCVGHSAPVKEIDWSDDNSYIQSQSMNFELLFWKALICRPVDNDDIVHDLKWTTHNCTIGFNVIGIWSDTIDSALINCCDKSNNDEFIVSATDTGYLNIYKWPTYYNQCSAQKYYGNVDKFNFTKFLPDDSRLVAVGAKSCATTVWSIIKEDV